ncbi:hypothetical protein F0U61_39715 [Archangium violaceum]|nr:hypothetical protein F0U61_39715 [Archangium violaceum]
MKLAGAVVLLVCLAGCATTQGTGGSGPSRPPPGVQPATKKELPWLDVPGGRIGLAPVTWTVGLRCQRLR